MFARMKNTSPVIVVGLLLTLVCLLLYVVGPKFIQTLSNYVYDAFLNRSYVAPQSGQVVIVDLDDQSLQELGQWPWSRFLVAKLTEKILDADASVVAFDIVFAEKDRTSPRVLEQNMKRFFKADGEVKIEIKGIAEEMLDFDSLFVKSLKKGNAILGCEMLPCDEMAPDTDVSIDPHYKSHYLVKGTGNSINEYLLQADSVTIAIPDLTKVANTAFFNAVTDPDSIVRSNPLIWSFGDRRIYPSLALEAIRLHLGVDSGVIEYDKQGVTQIRLRDLTIPTDQSGRLVVNYRSVNKNARTGLAGSFPSYSASDVLNDKVDRNALAGKIVFIGTSAVGLKDVKATPLTQFFSGVEVHATMVDNMLARDMLSNPSWMIGVHSVAILLMGIFLSIFISKGQSWLSFLVSLAMILLAIKASLLLMEKLYLVFVPAWLILSIIIIYPVLTMIKFWQEEQQKRKVRDMFGTMVSADVLNYLENNPESFSLSGKRAEATMFFSDVAGFTTISENLAPDKLSELLNRYLSPMTQLIMDRRGYVDKYEGDLIMAEWGVPFEMKDHAAQACLAAIEQQQELIKLRPLLKEQFGHDIHVRMGINSGVVTAGNMGSDKRFQYTVMGDAVNLASRLEPANKDYGTLIIIGEDTYNESKEAIEARLLDKIVVVGKTMPFQIYELITQKGNLLKEKRNAINLYETALRLHWDRKWEEAIKILTELLKSPVKDKACTKLLQRILFYKDNPPADSWNGEHIRTSKD